MEDCLWPPHKSWLWVQIPIQPKSTTTSTRTIDDRKETEKFIKSSQWDTNKKIFKKIQREQSLHQWFPTGVPQRGVRGAAKSRITAFLLMFYYIECRKLSFYTQQRCRQIFLLLEGCREPKKVEKYCVTLWRKSSELMSMIQLISKRVKVIDVISVLLSTVDVCKN